MARLAFSLVSNKPFSTSKTSSLSFLLLMI
jgi:hypothetical protein